jgi:protein-S-isoprenylcysteine O-methyltransferase Ste14
MLVPPNFMINRFFKSDIPSPIFPFRTFPPRATYSETKESGLMTSGPDVVIIGAWIGAAVVWLIGGLNTKTVVRTQSAGSRLLEILPLLVVFVLLRGDSTLLRWTSMRFVPDTLGWQSLAAAVTVAGVLVAIWSRFYLGGNWSATVTVKQDHELIRSGPYSVVRHPIYSGLLLALLGTALAVGEIRGLLAVALALLAWKIKSRREESFMESEFGEQYMQYRQNVKGLVPFIW